MAPTNKCLAQGNKTHMVDLCDCPTRAQRCPTRKGQHVANYHRYLSSAPACSCWIAEGRPRRPQSLSNRTAHGALSIGCVLGEIETSRLPRTVGI